jgi:hypothetical protein
MNVEPEPGRVGLPWRGIGPKPLVPVYSPLSQKLYELTGKLLGLCFPEMK